MRTAKNIAVEAALVLGAGLIFSLLANLLSPRGLSLTRDYFPVGHRPITASTRSGALDRAGGLSAVPESALVRLREEGLQVADRDEVVRWYHDPRYKEGLFVFVDARNDEHYRSGHIPGAYLFDRYRAGEYLAEVLPVCLTAEKVAVYCTGGDCEDSEFAAITLRDAGVSPQKLFVYSGGMADWTAAGLPVESGKRNSGVLAQP